MNRSALVFAVSLAACTAATEASVPPAGDPENDAGGRTSEPPDVAFLGEDGSAASDAAVEDSESTFADASPADDAASGADSGSFDSGLADSGVTIDSCSSYLAAYPGAEGGATRYCGPLSGVVHDSRTVEWMISRSSPGGIAEHAPCEHGGELSGWTSYLNKCCVRRDDTGDLPQSGGFLVLTPHDRPGRNVATTVQIYLGAKARFTFKVPTNLMSNSAPASATIDKATGLLPHVGPGFFDAMSSLGFGYSDVGFTNGGWGSALWSGAPYQDAPTATFQVSPGSTMLSLEIRNPILGRSGTTDTCVGKVGTGALLTYKASVPLVRFAPTMTP